MSPARSSRSWLALAVVAATCGCEDPDRLVDPDGRDEHHPATSTEDLRTIPLKDVVGAVAGVPVTDASATLERWLVGMPDAAPLLAAWPRAHDGRLDLDRPPVSLTSLDASISPDARTRCGEVTTVFAGRRGPSLRMRLSIPATTPRCRGRTRASHLHGPEAVPLLRAAIASARVPLPLGD